MNILFRCDHCSREVNAPPRMSGKQAVCPFCRAVVDVPGTPNIEPHEIREFINTELADVSDNAISDNTSEPLKSKQHQHDSPGTAREALVSVAPAGSRSGRRHFPMERPPTGTAIPATRPASDELPIDDVEIPDALWYVRPDSGGQFGPASSVLLRQWKKEGRVGPDAWLWRAGWDNWQPAGSVFPDLAEPAPQVLAKPAEPARPRSSVEARIKWMRNRRARSRFLAIAIMLGVLVAISLVVVLLIVVGKGTAV